MMRIVAVGMRDVSTFGKDMLFVETAADRITPFEVHRDGRVVPREPTQTLEHLSTSVEKFNHAYLVETPVQIRELSDLPGYLDRFEITSGTHCRLRAT
jgi:hypothetical protein